MNCTWFNENFTVIHLSLKLSGFREHGNQETIIYIFLNFDNFTNLNIFVCLQIVTLNNTGLSITVDWVGRYLYWSEINHRTPGSTIYRLDLNQAERGHIYASKVLRRSKFIHSIDISPFKRFESSCCFYSCSHYYRPPPPPDDDDDTVTVHGTDW